MEELEAITREEKYLGHMTGICSEMPDPPITRLERFLYELCKCTKGNISFPVDEEGQIITGELGQVLASDGQGGLVWVEGGGAEWKASLKGILQGDISHPVFPDDLESIKEYAFYENDVIASETFPDSVKKIGNYAFYYCKNLALRTLPTSLESIGDYDINVQKEWLNSTFEGCVNLAITEIPEGTERIYYNVSKDAQESRN